MINRTLFLRLALLFGLGSTLPLLASQPSVANPFTETAVEQQNVIAVARPYGIETTRYDLLLIEQIPGKNQCWSVSGAQPVIVDPLLLNFDFTGHCRRATDSNGYSIRIDGQDYGQDYMLRIVPRSNQLLLVGTSRTGRGPEIVLGSTYGIQPGFMQIQLYPGWQFSKRTFDGQVLGHYYISGTQAAVVTGGSTPVVPVTPALSTTAPEPVSPDPDQPVETSTETTVEIEEQVIIEADEQSSANVRETAVTVETTTYRPAPVTPTRRRMPTPADFRR